MSLVLAFHGATGDGPGFERESDLSETADKHGFAVLYPTASAPDRFWSLRRADGSADVDHVRALIGPALAAACGDPARVYATGVSNGGGFAARIGCELAGTVAAIAPVAGGYSTLDACPAGRRVSVLEIHGDRDHVVPYDGRPPDGAGAPRRFVAGWARRDGCQAAGGEFRRGPLIDGIAWGGCDAGLDVEHLRLAGTDHGWPGADPPWPNHNPSGLRAGEEVWAFFSSHRLVR